MNCTQYILNISPTLDFHSNKGDSLPYYIFGTKICHICHLLCQSWDIKVFCMALGTKASCIHDLGDKNHIFAEDLRSFNQKVTKGGGPFGGKTCESDFKWDVTSQTFFLLNFRFVVPSFLLCSEFIGNSTHPIFEHLTIWVLVQRPYFHDPSTSRPPSQVPNHCELELELQVEKKSSESTPANTWMGKIYIYIYNPSNCIGFKRLFTNELVPPMFLQHGNKSIGVIGASERTEETSMSNSVRRKDIFNNHGLCWGRGGVQWDNLKRSLEFMFSSGMNGNIFGWWWSICRWNTQFPHDGWHCEISMLNFMHDFTSAAVQLLQSFAPQDTTEQRDLALCCQKNITRGASWWLLSVPRMLRYHGFLF